MKKIVIKAISILLSLILIICSAPFSAFADDSQNALENAIAAYESKMDGTIWLNMTDAYDAYVEANKALDAYRYGGASFDLSSYTDNLLSKTAAMTKWKQQYAKKFIDVISTGNQAFPDDSTGDTDLVRYHQYCCQNVLAWQRADESRGSKISGGTIGSTDIELWCYPNVVLLVDDSGNAPQFPILAMAMKNAYKSTRWIWQFYPAKSLEDNSNNSDFRLTDNWHASTTYNLGNRNYNWTWTMGLEAGNAVQEEDNGEGNMGFAMGQAGAVSQTYRTRLYHDGRWISMANVVRFAGQFDGYYKTYNGIPFYRNSGENAGDETGYINATYPIHVIRYDRLLNTMKETKSGFLNVSEKTYTQGGLRDILLAYDTATAVDPINVNYTDNLANVERIGNIIAQADEALISATAVEDAAGYENLRKAMNSKKGTYESGYEGYKADSWKGFTDAYEASENFFADVLVYGYNSSSNEQATSLYAQRLADYLSNYELETIYDKVDTAELEMLINEADDAIANKNNFTVSSYDESGIETVCKGAKEAIWGAEENYPYAKFKLNLSDGATALAAEKCIELRNAIYALRIDKTVSVPTAGDNSMVSALALAENYSSENYGNYSELASAVSAANSFVVTVNNITEHCVFNKISEYKDKVRGIISAINILRPAFDRITNGTFGSMTPNFSTIVRSTGDASGGPRWTLNFVRNNDIVVFRTEYPAFKVDLGGATLEWYSKDYDYDAHLDTVSICDESEDTKIGELVTSWSTTPFNPGAVNIKSVAGDYLGQLSASTEESSVYMLKNLTVSSSPATKLACDMDGFAVTDTSFIVDELLSSTQGESSDKLMGTVVTNKGTAYINADFTLSVPIEPKKTLSATTLPKMTAHTLESNLGMVYYWKYTKNTIRWQGYSHDRVPYNQTTYVMNIAPLIELINKAREYEDKEQIYQINAWNEFAQALSAARANMDYGNMNAEDIEAACQTRYTNLWNAFQTLKASPAANNASIHAAVEADENVGNIYKADNRDGRWSEARWNAFKSAYLEAASAIEQGGRYSDYNVRNYDEDEQSAIDAVAAALNTAYNELITYGCRADFSPVINAAKTALEDNLYTAESLEVLRDELKNKAKYSYLNMEESDKASVYAEQDVVDEISAEANAIAGVFESIPVQKEADVDDSALEAAKQLAKAEIKDPDAFSNIDEIKALIDSADNSRNVEICDGYTVTGVKYSTKEEINAAVTSLLSGLTVKRYELHIVDSQGNEINALIKDENGNEVDVSQGIDYATKITVYAPDNEEVDWFYSYSSNTVSETSSKYYTTDKWIHLTIRGNTTLTIKSAAQQTQTVKITYVNALTGKTFAVDYAAKGEEYTLSEAPILPYYTFAGYSLEADGETTISTITPNEDTIVFAKYEFNTENEYFTVSLGNINGNLTTTQYLPEDLEYNDLVEFTLGDGTYGNEESGIYQTGKKNGQYRVNGETYSLPGTNRNPMKYASNEIYAWVMVKEDDAEDWEEYREASSARDYLQNVEKVVMYGETYSFRVCENVYVIPYTEEEFNEAAGLGLIEGVSGEEKAAVYASSSLLKVNNEAGETQKVLMIGNFTLPEGNFTLVETGMLFKALTDGSIPEADLSLANAGSNGIARMKSNSHTSGNQFVISVNTKKFIGTNTTIGVKYRAYLIYTDGTQQRIVYSDIVTDSALIA